MELKAIIIVFKEMLGLINQLMLIRLFSHVDYNFDTKKISIYAISYFLLEVSFLNILPYEYFLVCSIALQLIFFMLVVQATIYRKIGLFILTLIIDSFLDIIIEQIEFFIKSTNHYEILSLSNKIIGFSLIAMLMVILVRKRRKKKILQSDQTFLYLYLSIGFFAGLMMLLFVSLYGNKMTELMNIFMTLTAFITVLSSLLISFIYIKKQNENVEIKDKIQLKEEMLILQEQYFQDMVDSYSELRSFRHDIKSYFTAIQHLIAEERFENLSSLTNQLDVSIKKNHIITCNNVYVGAIANHFYLICKKERINFSFEYQLVNELLMDTDQICSLFYNLLSNAVESAIKENNGREVSMVVRSKDRAMIIEITNTVSSDFDMERLSNFISFKKDTINHGIGLKNINRIVDLYSGHIEYNHFGDKLESSLILLGVIKNLANS